MSSYENRSTLHWLVSRRWSGCQLLSHANLLQQQRLDQIQPAINAFVRVHALGALVDHQSDEASVIDGGGLLEGVAVGAPAADELGAIALEDLIKPHERTRKALGVAFLGAQAEQGDALAGEVRLIQLREKFRPIGLQAACAATRDFLDAVARRPQDQRVVLEEAWGMADSYATSI